MQYDHSDDSDSVGHEPTLQRRVGVKASVLTEVLDRGAAMTARHGIPYRMHRLSVRREHQPRHRGNGAESEAKNGH